MHTTLVTAFWNQYTESEQETSCMLLKYIQINLSEADNSK